MIRLFLVILFLLVICPLFANDESVPFTRDDRDRLIRLEVRMDGLEKRMDDLNNHMDDMNSRMGSLERRIGQMEQKFMTLFMWGFGLVITAIIGLVGFILYDRRTTLAPVENKTSRLYEAMKEAAKNDSNLRDAMENASLW